MRQFIIYRSYFLLAIVLCVGVVVWRKRVESSGLETYSIGVISMLLLLLAAKFEQYPFDKGKIIRSRIAFVIWTMFLAGGLITSGAKLMAESFDNGWLLWTSIVFVFFGKPLADMYPQFRGNWWKS